MLKDILIYLLIMAVLRGLVTNGKFVDYFQFFSGLVLILMLVTPVLSNFGKSSEWFQNLEENLFHMDKEEMEVCINMAEGSLQKNIKKEYEKELEKQVEVFVHNQGMDMEEADVKVELKEEGWEISKVSGKLVRQSRKEKKEAKQTVETISIPKIRWNEEEEEGSKKHQRKETDSADGRNIKKQICQYFSIEKEQVCLWE